MFCGSVNNSAFFLKKVSNISNVAPTSAGREAQALPLAKATLIANIKLSLTHSAHACFL
jgi:hypothetical protein